MSANKKNDRLTPQQEMFKDGYLNPTSPTFSNAMQSAIAAGYSVSYANHITAMGVEWVDGVVRKREMVHKAEGVLNKTLDEDTSEDSTRHRTQIDVAKFVASRLDKKNYSERQEHTGADGKDLPSPILSSIDNDEVHSDNSPKED